MTSLRFVCQGGLIFSHVVVRNNQSLKGAVGAILCQNEAKVNISMKIDHQISIGNCTRKLPDECLEVPPNSSKSVRAGSLDAYISDSLRLYKRHLKPTKNHVGQAIHNRLCKRKWRLYKRNGLSLT